MHEGIGMADKMMLRQRLNLSAEQVQGRPENQTPFPEPKIQMFDASRTEQPMPIRQRLVSARLQEHLDFFRSISSQMKTLGEEIKDDELVSWLFISLPKSYNPLVGIMATQAANVTIVARRARIKVQIRSL